MNLMFQCMATTHQQIAGLADGLRERQAGAQGYRALKPKLNITNITAASDQILMTEMSQFNVDLGELGVRLNSEAGFRQLRSATTGRAKDTVELALVS